MKRRMLLILLCVTLSSCDRVSTEEAHRIVERYNKVVSEAYRRCDIRLIDSVVGLNTVAGKRLTGLIGVRFDMGVALDAELTNLEVTGVEQDAGELRIRTKECWRYRDLKIGSGELVGEESRDYYELLYVFKKSGGIWLAEETRFTAAPQVGRKTMPWGTNARDMHGVGPANGAETRSEQP